MGFRIENETMGCILVEWLFEHSSYIPRRRSLPDRRTGWSGSLQAQVCFYLGSNSVCTILDYRHGGGSISARSR